MLSRLRLAKREGVTSLPVPSQFRGKLQPCSTLQRNFMSWIVLQHDAFSQADRAHCSQNTESVFTTSTVCFLVVISLYRFLEIAMSERSCRTAATSSSAFGTRGGRASTDSFVPDTPWQVCYVNASTVVRVYAIRYK